MRGTRGNETPRNEITKELDLIRNALSNIDACDSLEQLRGLEGIAAKSYFASFSSLLNARVPDTLRMSGRTKHPPHETGSIACCRLGTV